MNFRPTLPRSTSPIAACPTARRAAGGSPSPRSPGNRPRRATVIGARSVRTVANWDRAKALPIIEPPPVAFLLLLLAACLTLVGCSEPVREACASIQICAPETPARETIRVSCDHSLDSPCTLETFMATLSASVGHLIDRPGSTLEAWVLGRDAASTRRIAKVAFSAPSAPGQRQRQTHHESEAAGALATLRRLVEPIFDSARVNRTPLVSAIGKLAQARSDDEGRVHLIFVSDSRLFAPDQVPALRDLECDVHDVSEFLEALQQDGTLVPESLLGSDVTFAPVELGPMTRCSVDPRDARVIEESWTVGLGWAGADHVAFRSDILGATYFRGLHQRLDDRGQP